MVRAQVVAAVLGMGIWVAAGAPVGAATFTVTSPEDSGPGSLREAMVLAEANGEPDEIVFAGDFTILLQSTLPTVTGVLTIRGNGWERTVVDGGNPAGGTSGVRAFQVAASGDLTLDGVTVRRCYSPNDGGAVEVEGGSMRVVDSVLRDNSTGGSYGGAILSEANATLVMEGTLLEANRTPYLGAAVAALNSAANTFVGCTFAGNSSQWAALAIHWGGTTLVDGCTFSGNVGTGVAAAQFQDVSVEIVNSTFSGNQGDYTIHFDEYGDQDVLELRNVTVANNSSIGLWSYQSGSRVSLSHCILANLPHANCSLGGGPPTTLGFNLEDADTCGLDPGAGDLVHTDPLLAPLRDNGGPTLTHEPQAASAAVDGGAADCGLAVDQRGGPRPVDGDGDGLARCDIGAVEVSVLFADGFEAGTTSRWSSVVP